MTEHHIPRKRFGQNFLKDNQVIEKIVRALHPQTEDLLVEIGPGLGALTAQVLQHIAHFHVIEIDNDLSARLKTTYPDSQLSVHQQDALRFNFASLCKEKQKLRVFGNLPYNISTPLLFHLLSFAPFIQDMLFMLQKEVVVRMSAAHGHHEYGRLSIMIQYACEVHHLFDVSPQSFTPPPKVMSSIVLLKPYGEKRPFALARDEKLFSKIVATAFQHRRKTLKNALTPIVPAEVFSHTNIDPMRRPETLSVEEFIALSDALVEISS